MTILIGLIIFIVLYFIIDFFLNFEITEEIYDLIKRRIYRNNPNRYFYKCLKKGESVNNAFFRMHEINSIPYFGAKFLFDPLKKREKDIWLGVIRFNIGLINTDFFEDNKKALIDTIYQLAIPETFAPYEHFYVNENIVINNFQVLEATYQIFHGARNKNFTFVFENKKTREIISVNLSGWSEEVAKEKFSFLFS